MDDTLKKLMHTFKNYDEDLIEDVFEQLKYENYQYSTFADLVAAVKKILTKRKNSHFDNTTDYKQYAMKEKILSRYEKVDPHEFYRYKIPEDSLQICDELDSKNGVGNAIRMDIVNQWILGENGKKYCIQKGVQTVITDDLSFLFVRPKRLDKCNIVLSNININSYFGNRRLRNRIDKVFGFIIDIDGVIKESQMLHLLDEIEKENVPIPTFIVNSGHGVHLYYVFDEPVLFHDNSYAIYPVLTNILNAIKNLIWTPLVSDLKPERMDLNKAFTIVGTSNRKNADLIATAYRMKSQKCSLQYLRAFIKRPADDADYDISFPPCSKVKKEEAAILYPQWSVQKFPELFSGEERRKLLEEAREKRKGKNGIKNESANRCNPRLYEWFLNLISNPSNIRHGNRYKCMVGLAIFGVKCGIPKEQVQKDLEQLLPLFNAVEKRMSDSRFIMNQTDIRNALYVYKHKETRLFTFEWIKNFTEIEYEKKTKRRNKPLSQEEHLKLARKKLEEQYPNGSWRANSDGATKQRIIDYIRENPTAEIKDCIKSGICSRASAYKYWDECHINLGMDTRKRISNAEKVKYYRLSQPTATKADCIRELGLSKPTVYKYWE